MDVSDHAVIKVSLTFVCGPQQFPHDRGRLIIIGAAEVERPIGLGLLQEEDPCPPLLLLVQPRQAKETMKPFAFVRH